MIRSHQALGHSFLCPRGWTLTCPLHGCKSKSAWRPFPFDHWAKILRTTKCHANSIFLAYHSVHFLPKIRHLFCLRCSWLPVSSSPSLRPLPDLLCIPNMCLLMSEMPLPKETTLQESSFTQGSIFCSSNTLPSKTLWRKYTIYKS